MAIRILWKLRLLPLGCYFVATKLFWPRWAAAHKTACILIFVACVLFFVLCWTIRYIRQKRAEGMESFGLTHVLLAAYVRCIAKYPGVNRFFSGQRVYQRDDDVQFTMTIKKDMRTDGEETTIKLHLTPTDTT